MRGGWQTITVQQYRGQVKHPDQEAQARREHLAALAQWQAARDRQATTEALLRRIEDELLPQIESDLGTAEAQLEAARWQFFMKTARTYGGPLVEVDGRPALALDLGEEEKDAGVVAARAHVTELRAGRNRLLERQSLLRGELAAVASGPPPGL